MADMQVNILSPAKVVAKTQATGVHVPGANGYLGILPGHAALVTELGVGQLTVEGRDSKQVYFISGGYLEVANDNVTLLVDIIERPEDIDVKRAELSKQRALDRLNQQKMQIDVMRAQASLQRANQRIDLHNQYR